MTRKIAVIVGCGIMGSDVAAIFLSQGWDVQAVARDETKWDAVRARVARAVQQLDSRGTVGTLRLVTDIRDLAWSGVQFGLETVPEDFEAKRKLFAELDRLVPPQIPLLTNTSGLRISEIARDCATRERMGGLHFFLPAHLVPAVEVVRGELTQAWVIDRLSNILRSVDRIPIRVEKDVPGFLANRIQHALMREAFAVIDEGLARPEDVDAAVRFGFGFRYVAAGPILQKELSGLDTQLAAGRSIYPALNTASKPSRVLTELVASGHYGTKTGQGFWKWTPEGIAAEQQRFERALIAAVKLLKEDGQGTNHIPVEPNSGGATK
ncbi:3-hydroxyacyl-CoA dehydrogenase [Bradyrhizobium sp. CCBAU 53421]|nr:3-hydroxyacyl-CoA dehydrogenase [Bradyrhizobium sp. CCBAU 53421]